MDQYGIEMGENGDPTRMVVWGQDETLVDRRALRDALCREAYLVSNVHVEQAGEGPLPFVGTIYFRPVDDVHQRVLQMHITTTDSRVIPGVCQLFADVREGRFGRVGVDAKADSGGFLNFHILFYPSEAPVTAVAESAH